MSVKTSQKILDRVLSILIVLIVLSTLGMLAYQVASPGTKEKFTEFYILGLDGQANDYPTKLKVGEEGKIIIGIINREQAVATYRVEIRIDGAVNDEVGPITLQHNENWQDVVRFTPVHVGDKQKVEFLLYKAGQTGIYQQLYLYVDVQ